MKSLILITALLSLACAACAGGGVAAPKAGLAAPQFKAYVMDNNYFSCNIPVGWDLQRDKDSDEKYSIYEIELIAPVDGKAPTAVFVSYYSRENTDFNGYANYISRNSKNILGETKSARENYEPVKKIKLAKRKGFELSNETMEYLHPESKSDESVQLKEKMYVLPAKEGFYVLKFNAPKTEFLANLPVFEKIAKSFKGKP